MKPEQKEDSKSNFACLGYSYKKYVLVAFLIEYIGSPNCVNFSMEYTKYDI